MRFTRFVRRIILLAALPLLLLAIPAASAATATPPPARPPAPAGSGWPTFRRTRRRWTSTFTRLATRPPRSCCTTSRTARVPVRAGAHRGLHRGDARGGRRLPPAPPVLSASVDVAAGHAYTVAGLGPESGLRLQVLDDQLTTPSGPGAGADHPGLAQAERGLGQLGRDHAERASLAFGSVTSYQTVSAGTETLTRQRQRRERDTSASRLPPGPCTRWWSSTGPRACRSTTCSTRPAAAPTRSAARRPGSAGWRRALRPPRCRGWR